MYKQVLGLVTIAGASVAQPLLFGNSILPASAQNGWAPEQNALLAGPPEIFEQEIVAAVFDEQPDVVRQQVDIARRPDQDMCIEQKSH